jgi:hypothetical protein
MTHLNSNSSDAVDEQSLGEEARATKPADTVYRIAAMVGALILLFTIVWAG